MRAAVKKLISARELSCSLVMSIAIPDVIMVNMVLIHERWVLSTASSVLSNARSVAVSGFSVSGIVLR